MIFVNIFPYYLQVSVAFFANNCIQNEFVYTNIYFLLPSRYVLERSSNRKFWIIQSTLKWSSFLRFFKAFWKKGIRAKLFFSEVLNVKLFTQIFLYLFWKHSERSRDRKLWKQNLFEIIVFKACWKKKIKFSIWKIRLAVCGSSSIY